MENRHGTDRNVQRGGIGRRIDFPTELPNECGDPPYVFLIRTIRSDLRKYGVLRDERGGGGDPESVFSDNIGQFEQRIVVIPVAVNAYDDGRRPVSPELAERRQRGCGNASGIDGHTHYQQVAVVHRYFRPGRAPGNVVLRLPSFDLRGDLSHDLPGRISRAEIYQVNIFRPHILTIY